MSEEGCEALRKVLREGRVALAACPRVVYLIEGSMPSEPNWLPVSLAPVSMANVQAGQRFFSMPPQVVDQFMEMHSASGRGGIIRRLDAA